MEEVKMAQLKAERDEVFDNRTIVTGMADEAWTRHILEVCVNEANSGSFETSIDTSLITVDGDWETGVTYESEHYDEDTLFLVKMSVINGNEFWTSDTMTLAETQAQILFDSGFSYPEVEEALALVDFREANHALLGSMSAKNTNQNGAHQ